MTAEETAERDEIILKLWNVGASLVDLADQFWLGDTEVRDILSRLREEGHDVLAAESPRRAPLYTSSDARLPESIPPLGQRAAEAAIFLAGKALSVPFHTFRQPNRGKKDIAFARQVAMYLTAVVCDMGPSEVGVLFDRDRTSVSHATALVEDRRDDPEFDDLIDLLERGMQDILFGEGPI